MLFLIGWDKDEKIYGCTIHIDIIGEKIWIQYDGTDIGIAEVLHDKGISKEDIVLGFHHPSERKYTDYAKIESL